MPQKRIPTPSQDAGNWGTILNDHLAQTQNPLNGAFNSFDQFSARPTNLTADDAGKTYLYTQTGNWHEWSGTEWKVQNKSEINVKDYGAIGDGVVDDTANIQKAVDKASEMFNQVAFPPIGNIYTPAIVLFPTGAYRITDTIIVPTGLTLRGSAEICYTVSSTRIIMDTQGGTENQDKNIFKLTSIFQGATRSNSVTCSITDLEFWITNPGNPNNIFTRDGQGWGTNSDNNNLGLYKGCAIYVSEAVIDTRIKRCNFYSMPNAAIFFNGTDNRVLGCLIQECEFDTPIVDIRAKNVNLDLTVQDCEFFAGSHTLFIENCTGIISLYGNRFVTNPSISVTNSSNLSQFNLVGNSFDLCVKNNSILVSKSESINITGNTFGGAGSQNCISLSDCEGGVINSNVFINSGYNAFISNPEIDPSVINLNGCKNVVVIGNSIITPANATYGGFGIITKDNGTRLSKCLVTSNIVSSKYIGGNYRSQSRPINLSSNDINQNNLIT